MTTADQIIELIDKAGQATGYGEFTAAFANSSWARNRAKVLLGLHRGPAFCQVACAVVPTRPYEYRLCVDGQGDWCETHGTDNYVDTFFSGAWARAKEITWEVKGGDYNVCFLFKNWKHDWDRVFTWTIYY
jgi:hypothetical protein